MQYATSRVAPGRHVPGLLCLVFLCLFSHPALAQRAQLRLESDMVELGQTSGLHLLIWGAVPGETPLIPVSQHLRIDYVGMDRSGGAGRQRVLTFNYTLTAMQTGTAQVGPVVLPLAGRVVTAGAVELEIVPRSNPQGGAGRLDAALLRAAALSPVVGSESRARLWRGETLVFRLTLTHRGSLLDARWTAPRLQGLVEEPLAGLSQREYQVSRSGLLYRVKEIYLPLLVMGAVGDGGQAQVGVSSADMLVRYSRGSASSAAVPGPGRRAARDALAGASTDLLSSSPIGALVLPLPQEDRPSGFSGLVGRFQVKASLSEREVPLGGSVTVTVNLQGDATLAGLQLPPFPRQEGTSTESLLRSYDDLPQVHESIEDGRFSASATLRRAIVPLREGDIALPPLRFSWFDPVGARYVEKELDLGTLHVTPGSQSNASQMVSFSESVDTGLAQARPLAQQLPAWLGMVWGWLLGLDWTLVLMLAGLGLLLSLVLRWGLGAWNGRDKERMARRRELRLLVGKLPGDPRERARVLERALRRAVSLATGLPPSAVDESSIVQSLPGEWGPRVGQAYREIYDSRYGGEILSVHRAGELRVLILEVARLRGDSRA